MFRIEISTEGAAFKNQYTGENDDYECGTELKRVMSKVAKDVMHGETSGKVRDVNGNTVGSWSMNQEDVYKILKLNESTGEMEVIDTAENLEEATFLVAEYETAFNR